MNIYKYLYNYIIPKYRENALYIENKTKKKKNTKKK